MSRRRKTSSAGAEVLESAKQMRAGKKGRTYTKEQLLAISARKSVDLTQREFARLLDVSVDTIQDWEQGRRSPRGAAKTLLKIARLHPEVFEQLSS